MKAYVLENVGKIELKSIAAPSIRDGEALVRVRAVGICGSDIPRIYSDGAHVMPIVPGHEFSGEVVSTFAAKDKEWIGKRVGVFPLIPCMKCSCCKNKKYEMCKSYSYLGSRQNGGFAEYVNVPVWNLIELPEGVSFEEGAILEPLAVAVHAVRAMLNSEEDVDKKRVIVSGLGTIGLMVVSVLKAYGIFDICGIGNKEYQKNNLKKIGAYAYCNAKDIANSELSNADYVFECVGSNDSITNAITLTKEAGKVMMVGNPKSDVELNQKVYWQILRKQLTVQGTWNSSFTKENEDDWQLALELLAKKKIDVDTLISHRLSIDNLSKGFELMKDKSENYTKVCGVFE